jgi:hypothetical protein
VAACGWRNCSYHHGDSDVVSPKCPGY